MILALPLTQLCDHGQMTYLEFLFFPNMETLILVSDVLLEPNDFIFIPGTAPGIK